ncbi:Nucleolar protein 4 [Yarrowia sp. C11]|nr:Nucleolar protein 4 [Yarrowia sp. C11]KAG5358716.1 Nucleolar protein 4 [Yarrowia sp. E02]
MVRDAKDKVDKGKTDLFVRSIPLEVTNEELADFFSQDFPVKHAVVVTNAATKESKGFGFVSFTTEEDAAEALMKCRKQKLKGKILQIEFAKPRERKTREDRPFESRSNEDTSVEKRKPRLIVRNLPWSVREPQDLIKVFSKFGKVVDAFIPRGVGGKMSGFGFVTMSKKQHADKAVAESKGLEIDGRTVTVDFAIQKDQWLKSKDGQEVKEEEYDDDEEDEDVKEEDDDEIKDEVKDEDLDLDESNADVAEGDDDEDDIEEDEEEEEEEEDTTPKVKAQSNSSTVFVRNIPYDATAESLKEHFELFGTVRYALPVMDKATGQPRGTAFVAFESSDDCDRCVERAPAAATTSLLVADDTDPRYVFEGRILAVTQAVQRETAEKLSEHNSKKRAEALGKLPKEKDRRNVFLINEGRIGENSALGMTLPKADMELRQKSYDQRKKQLNGNPSLHVSLTRLALRNLPRALNAKGLKALGRKAVVQFATEAKEGARQPLSKEEAIRSTKARGDEPAKSKHGVVRQAKVIMEQKESGELGRSRGYGFLEFRDHKAALMALRWLNAHEVSTEEVLEGYEEKERKHVDLTGSSRRHLVAEFAIENAQVVKRRKETMARINMQKKRNRDDEGGADEGSSEHKRPRREGRDRDRKGGDRKDRKGDRKGKKEEPKQPEKDKNLELGKLIGQKRMRKKKGGK